MAVTMRHRTDEGYPVRCFFPTGFVIEPGHVIWSDGANGCKPASAVAFTTLAAAQQLLHASLVGSSMCGRLVGDAPGPGAVATEGVHEYDCAALGAQVEMGTLVGMAANVGNTGLENQKVVVVGATNLAIGRTVERAPAGATTLKVRLFGSVTTGGPQAIL
jgi:hypothetical protein